jgi:hypothetical protein
MYTRDITGDSFQRTWKIIILQLQVNKCLQLSNALRFKQIGLRAPTWLALGAIEFLQTSGLPNGIWRG